MKDLFKRREDLLPLALAAAFAASGYMVYRTLRRMEAEEKSAGAA